MNRPDEPTEALPTRAVPLDPQATVDLDRTLTGGGEPPARPSTTDATVHLLASDDTVHLAASPGTGHLAGSDATVHLAAPEQTVRLGAPDVTARPAASDATAQLAASDATARFAGPDATARFTGPEATARLATPGRTVPPGTAAGGPGATWPAGPVTDAGLPTQVSDAAPGRGGTTGAYHGETAGARRPDGPVPPASGGELRFGPGVPATPPPAPPWPAALPARRPRPRWRRVASVLSSLLTAALLLVVALYLWQRLSPLEVEGVTVAVARPAGDRCDVTVDVVATVRTNGRAGVIRYQWLRSDAPTGTLLTERVGPGERTVTLTLQWTFSGVGATTETATVNLVEPAPLQAGTQVTYRCAGG